MPEEPLEVRPGLVWCGHDWHVRRHGLIDRHGLTCRQHHKIKIREQDGELIATCEYREPPGYQLICMGRLYVVRYRPPLIWAMDVNIDEARIIKAMTHDEAVEWFGVGFPSPQR